jgi:hypothetical protein
VGGVITFCICIILHSNGIILLPICK